MDPVVFNAPDGSDAVFPFSTGQSITRSGGQRGGLLAPFQPIPANVGVAHDAAMNLMDIAAHTRPPHASSSGLMATSGKPVAIPVQKDDSNFKETDPVLAVDDGSTCAFCQSRADYRDKIIAGASFTCEIGGGGMKNLREKANSICFRYRVSGSTSFLRNSLKFKVYAGSTIRRGKRSLRRDCFSFKMGAGMVAHIYCRTPLSGRGSLKWTEEKREKFLALEDGMLFTTQMISTRGGGECHITAKYPLGLLVSDSPYARAADLRDGDASKRFRDGTDSWESGKKMRINGSIVDQELVLEPDLNAKASSASVGFRVASYSFKCQMLTGHKNLRQRASTFSLVIARTDKNIADEDQQLRHLKFKIYADSTIRRGKKTLRRNDFVFRIDPNRILNVFCKTPSATRGSLKWTVEKQEAFLAMECGLEYIIQVYSKFRDDDARVYKIAADEEDDRVVDWNDDMHPERSQEIAATKQTPEEKANDRWRIEPPTWNLSMNTAPQFLAMVMAPPGVLPDSPMVVFHAKDKKIEVSPYQYDHRSRRSILIAVPRLFSEEKAEQATLQGVHFSRQVAMHVLNAAGQTVWATKFTYEIGMDTDKSSGSGASQSSSAYLEELTAPPQSKDAAPAESS